MATTISKSVKGDALTIQWGETGRTHTVPAADPDAVAKAYRAALAEAVANGQVFTDEVERSVVREMQKDVGLRIMPRDPAGTWFDAGTPDDVFAQYANVGLRKDANGSLIVAWWPDADTQSKIAQLGGYPMTSDLHVTLLYLGDPALYDVAAVAAVCKLLSMSYYSGLDGCVSGLGRFVGPEDTDVIVALLDVPGLGGLRHCVKDELNWRNVGADGNYPIIDSEQHGFLPHITLAYIPKGQNSPPPLAETFPICIDNLAVCTPGAQVVFPFNVNGGPSEADPAPYFAARDALALHKAGRVLSAKNMASLRAAQDTITTVLDAATPLDAGEATGDEGTTKAITAEQRSAFLKSLAGAPTTGEGGAELLEYAITKSADEDRFTLGPLYAPLRQDAHGEWVEADTLQKSVWDYVQGQFDKGDNRLNLQHGDLGDVQVARMVEIMAWPDEHTITVTKSGDEARTLTMPAGTVYLGAIWDEDAWPLVKSGKLNGWSLGGRAVRVAGGDALDHMGDKIASARVTKFAKHSYVTQDDGGGVCKVCHMSSGDGNHG